MSSVLLFIAGIVVAVVAIALLQILQRPLWSQPISLSQDFGPPAPWYVYKARTMLAALLGVKLVNQLMTPPARIMDIAIGYIHSQALIVANKFEIADHLGVAGEKSVSELARLSGAHEESLGRLLRTLSTIGVFEEVSKDGNLFTGIFRNNALSSVLMSNHVNSMRAQLSHIDMNLYGTFGDLYQIVKTGRSRYRDQELWKELESQPERRDVFARAMGSTSAFTNSAIAKDYDLSDVKTIVDVGSGIGSLLSVLMYNNPHLQGTLFDLFGVIEDAKKGWNEKHSTLVDRASFVAGSFMEKDSIPKGKDAYIVRGVVHNYDDQKAIAVLSNVRAAMGDRKDCKLLLAEYALFEKTPSPNYAMDMIMMAFVGGKQRTEQQFKDILKAAGLEWVKPVEIRSPMKMIEARPI